MSELEIDYTFALHSMPVPKRGKRNFRLVQWTKENFICLITAVVGSSLWFSSQPLIHDSEIEVSSFERPVLCNRLLESSMNASDARKKRLFLRYTKDYPHFWISLHSKKYDPVRWATLQYGRYYEQKLVSLPTNRCYFTRKVV